MPLAVVKHRKTGTADTFRTRSPDVWRDFPFAEIADGTKAGLYFYDDFQDYPLIGTQTTQIGFGKYKVFNTGAGTVSKVEAVNSVELVGGALSISLDTDNDQGSIAQAYPSYLLSGLNTTSGILCFEACYAQNSIATNMAAVMLGLAETEQWTLATAVPFNAGDPITNSASFIGFRLAEDGLGVVDTVYSDRSTSFTNVAAGEGGTIAANTFVKLGMRYDPNDVNRCVRFYVNNVEAATAMTRAALIAMTNLDANALGLIWSSCADSAGTSFAGYLKWWAVGQLVA